METPKTVSDTLLKALRAETYAKLEAEIETHLTEYTRRLRASLTGKIEAALTQFTPNKPGYNISEVLLGIEQAIHSTLILPTENPDESSIENKKTPKDDFIQRYYDNRCTWHSDVFIGMLTRSEKTQNEIASELGISKSVMSRKVRSTSCKAFTKEQLIRIWNLLQVDKD